jgi:hypothetical protein
LFERNSPRAMRVLRSLLLTFLDNSDSYTMCRRIDLAK